jgi:orotidine-5'-phosphate decarboxylase
MKHMGLKAGCPYKKTIDYINETYPAIFTIADAKRGDIDSSMYAKAFEDLNFDSVTVAPYMGKDSVEPSLPLKQTYNYACLNFK